jgi:ankyrin repeat protein/TPR repeat protein
MAEKRKRAPKEKAEWGSQERTPTGGLVRKGKRGEGDCEHEVEKRLKPTPHGKHLAEFETCDKIDCSQENRCKDCKKHTNQAIQRARRSQGVQGTSKNRRKALEMFDDDAQEDIEALSASALSKRIRREENAGLKATENDWKRMYRNRWKSIEYFQMKADKSDEDEDTAFAQDVVARSYDPESRIPFFSTFGREKDDEKAFLYYQKAADGGDVDAQETLGVCYWYGGELGLGLEADVEKAVAYWRKAASSEEPSFSCSSACSHLGELYWSGGDIIEENHEEALKFLHKAADGEYPIFSSFLGEAYEHGKGGVEVDLARALEYYQKAAAEGEWEDIEGLPYAWERLDYAYANAELGLNLADAHRANYMLFGRPLRALFEQQRKKKMTLKSGTKYAGQVVYRERLPEDEDHLSQWPDSKTPVAIHGKGKMKWPDGRKYVGSFVQGERHGKGKMKWPDGMTYVGDFVENKRHGKGKMTWPDGTEYVGGFVDNHRHGKGKIAGPRGEAVGVWEGGNFSNGTIAWPSGQTYSGGFDCGKPHGSGEMTWADGSKYVGCFYGGKRHGQCTFKWPDFRGPGGKCFGTGGTFWGYFQDDMMCGVGAEILFSGPYPRFNGRIHRRKLDVRDKKAAGCALILAAYYKSTPMVAHLLSDERVDPNFTTGDGTTALMFAAHRGYASVVKLLLADGRVDPNMTDQDGRTAIFIAAKSSAKKDHASVVKLLLADERVDPNIASEIGSTLIIAALKGYASVVTLLLADERVDPNIANQNGSTALTLAAREDHASVVTLLLADERVGPNIANQYGSTALILAAKKGHASVVTLLLADDRVDPNIANQEGYTALHHAALRGHPRVMALLDYATGPKGRGGSEL